MNKSIKRVYLITLLLISFILGAANIYAKTDTVQNVYPNPIIQEGLNQRFLGRGVNVFNAVYGSADSIIVNTSIFDTNWLDSLQYTIISQPSVYTNEYSGYSKNEYLEDIYNSNNLNISAQGSYSYFSGTAETEFTSTWNSNTYLNSSTYFYTKNVIVEKNRMYINNSNSLIQGAPLDSSFKNELIFLETQVPYNEHLNYASFILSKYGTHVLFDAIYGGEININFSSNSTQLDLKTMLSQDANIAANASILSNSLISLSVNSNFRNVVTNADSSISTSFSFSAKTKGGVGFILLSETDITPLLPVWNNSLEDDAKKVMIGYNTLTPIWEVIPSSIYIESYGNVNLNYIKSLLQNAYNKISLENKVVSEKEKSSQFMFANNHTITKRIEDKNVWQQNQFYGFDINLNTIRSWKSKGYTKVNFTVYFTAREIHDGYQELYLVIDDQYKLLDSITKYELTPGSRQINFTKNLYSFNTLNLNQIETYLSYTTNSSLKLFLGANGNGEDTWEIKDVYIKYALS